jgi:polysaccharide chain length determinant protein (PEP-CTERM system associated)
MMKNGTITVADAKRVLRKYWWILPLATLTCGILGYVGTRVLPKKYKSMTTVLVEQPVVPPDYVRPVVQEDLNHHLASMQAQVLSSSRLQPIIEKFNLYSDQKGLVSDAVLQNQLRNAIDVELMQPMIGSVNRQPPGFSISVTFDDPRRAQQICQEVTNMFMDENKKNREGKAEATTSFLGDQLVQAKAKLDEKDAKLAEFKRKYLGELPEEVQSNLNLLNGLNTQLEANTQAINRAQQDKALNEALLTQEEANWKATLAGGGEQNTDTLESQLATLKEQLHDLLLRYKPDHPDVIKLRSQVEDLERRIAETPLTPATPAPPSASAKTPREPAQLQQTRGRIKQDDLNTADLTRRQGQIQTQINTLQAKVQATPMVEEQFKELNRDYQTAQQVYDQLLKNQSDASIATKLEQQQESERFQTLDAPDFPSAPSFPKPLQFIGGGLGGGLVLGLGILYLIVMADQAIYSERDVELALKLPVLTVVPSLDQKMSRKNREAGHLRKFEPSVPLKA